METSVSGGEDVNEFLMRIREMGDRRDKEDEDRAKKLEQDILAGREARRARRDERARSLSPQKDGETLPYTITTGVRSRKLSMPADDSDGSTGETPAPTLSWQRRPKSVVGLSGLSKFSAIDKDEENSRSQIIDNLSTKDPAWFRQTQERAATSGALRKSEEEGLKTSLRKALPGMGAGLLEPDDFEPQKGPPISSLSAESLKSGTNQGGFSRFDRAPQTFVSHTRNSSLTSNASGRFELEPQDASNRPPPMSPSQERLSPDKRERTPSPTKGLGGFVQSAMLKREGSINKRWSREQVGAVSRNNSNSSNRKPFSRGGNGSVRERDLVPSHLTRDSSPTMDDHPIEVVDAVDNSHSAKRARAKSTSGFLAKPSSPADLPYRPRRDSTPPASPTKTFEQKRWSPTKSSWLETALKKGTDNVQTTPPPPMKPLPPPKHVEETRVKPPLERAATPPILTAKPFIAPKPSILVPKPKLSQELLKKMSEKPSEENLVKEAAGSSPKPAVAVKPSSLNRPPVLPPTSIKPDIPTKPSLKHKETINFRAGLKPRAVPDKDDNKEELPPFLNAMSRLRSTKTQNYKAPDELKELILEGKAGLNTTGGPQKSLRVDPLKESIVSAKGSLRPSDPSPTKTVPIKNTFEPKPKLQAGEKKVSSLADRFNPNLSSLLQRGPPSAASGNSFKPLRSSDTTIGLKSSEVSVPESPGPLSHITKGRARGPKRRVPTKIEGTLLKESGNKASQNNSGRIEPVTLPVTPSKVPNASQRDSINLTPVKADRSKPPTPDKSPLLKGKSSPNLKESARRPSSANSQEEVTRKPPLIRSSSTVVKREPSFGNLPRPALQSPQLMADDEGEVQTDSPKAPMPLPKMEIIRSSSPVVETPQRRPLPKAPQMSSSPSPSASPAVGRGVDVDNSQLLSEHFKGPLFRASKATFDIMSILASSPAIPKERVKTVQFDVSEITGDGKLTSIPREEQHLFFDESMYLCVHRFEAVPGREQVEVYLWSGNKVSESATQDVQLFARKAATEHDTKLVMLKQGREIGPFFQAIGGILVTRRGTKHRSPIDSSFMLCGRSCFGAIAFDEVDMKVSSLCSGFPFIVTWKGGVYLWKGKGATSEEIGLARLVGFENAGGEVKEYNEGEESDAFFSALGEYSDRKSADYWHLRPSCKKYAARLFRIDLQAPSKVVEISPFCQDDLDTREIYVADAFFEFYIVVGAQSQSKCEEFQIALQFTHEYSVLAVSVEDRPFVPVSSVILGGAPREFKALFRDWEDEKTPTVWQPTRKPSLRIIGLQQAVKTMGE